MGKLFYKGNYVGAIQGSFNPTKSQALNIDRLALYMDKIRLLSGLKANSDSLMLSIIVDNLLFEVIEDYPLCPHGDSVRTYTGCKIENYEKSVTVGQVIVLENAELTYNIAV
jgi:hypothetical protein